MCASIQYIYTLSVLLPQAPGYCNWGDVCHLLNVGDRMSFSGFLSTLQFMQLPSADYQEQCLDPTCLEVIEREWEAAILAMMTKHWYDL